MNADPEPLDPEPLGDRALTRRPSPPHVESGRRMDCIGIEVSDASTVWVTVAEARRLTGSGSFRSEVVAGPGGALVAGPETADQVAATTGFVGRLGDATPVMVGGSPYGIESLVGRLIDAARRGAGVGIGDAPAGGSLPGVVALVHADGFDEYRTGLLVEAARLAGVAPADVELVSHTHALAAAASLAPSPFVGPEHLAAAGAALVAADRRTPESPAAEPGAAIAGGAAGGAIGVVAGTTFAGADTATAGGVTSAAGYAGTPLDTAAAPYAGTPLDTPPGPYAGTPLSVPAEGYTGTPMADAYLGTPLTDAYRGTPLPSAASRISRGRIAIIAASAVLVVGAGTALVLRSGSDAGPPSAAPTATTPGPATVATSATLDVTTASPSTDSAPTAPVATSTIAPTSTTSEQVDPRGVWTVTILCGADPCQGSVPMTATFTDWQPGTGAFTGTLTESDNLVLAIDGQTSATNVVLKVANPKFPDRPLIVTTTVGSDGSWSGNVVVDGVPGGLWHLARTGPAAPTSPSDSSSTTP